MSNDALSKNLWNEVLDFDLDQPLSEYNFSIRLAIENKWTEKFTERAILEYKKFMYLAATSDHLVSPSEIIDKVWHQHLIFTHSYSEFCKILGKVIQHVPSLHSSSDFERLSNARKYTNEIYRKVFGVQPVDIWLNEDMLESLDLPKAKYKIRSVVIVGILSFIALSFPLYHLFKPFIIKINNPYYVFNLFGIAISAFLFLEIHNRLVLKRIINKVISGSFLEQLTCQELIYLENLHLRSVIYISLSKLLKNNKIELDGRRFKIKINERVESVEELTVYETLKGTEPGTFPDLIYKLEVKPYYNRTKNSMDAFKKYFIKSKAFAFIFYSNFCVLAGVEMIAFLRYLTGISRNKPVVIIFTALVILSVLSILFLYRLTNLVCTLTIPSYYAENVLSDKDEQESDDWQYFLLGTAIFPSMLTSLIWEERKGRNKWPNDGSGGSCGSACSSGGGSSCGSCSSCGGCGGGSD